MPVLFHLCNYSKRELEKLTLLVLFHLGKFTLGNALLRVDIDAKLDWSTSVLDSSSFANGGSPFPLESQVPREALRLCRQHLFRTSSVWTPLATLVWRFRTPQSANFFLTGDAGLAIRGFVSGSVRLHVESGPLSEWSNGSALIPDDSLPTGGEVLSMSRAVTSGTVNGSSLLLFSSIDSCRRRK